MENAFDRVKHSFLLKVLKKLGFDATFEKWVALCISSPWIAPLVNGQVARFFKSSRGLRQGCTVSPFLYIVMEDSLSISLEHEIETHKLLCIRYKEGIRSINHEHFAEDTILLGRASVAIDKHFKVNLDKFLSASEGDTNDNKIHIYTSNISP